MRWVRWSSVVFVATSSLAARAEPPVLHEPVPGLGPAEAAVVLGADGRPAALLYGSEVIPEPDAGPLRMGEVPMRAAGGDGAALEERGRRSPTFRPDRVTALHDTVRYDPVFTPSISPYKRVTALDRVVLGEDGRTPVLGISDAPRRRVAVAAHGGLGGVDDARDDFWGSVVLDFSEGRTVPFPSVAPDARILSVRTEPAVRLVFERDAADNLYATAVSPATAPVRVTFLMDAPRTYFGGLVPEVSMDALAVEVPPVPEPVVRRARRFAEGLGLDDGHTLVRALDVLVSHFRAFEESEEPPPDTGDVYLDLARGMRGVCRHRAYAFVVTAQALGIPARFVQNEAHAWVEVRLPARGWLRIELGGAARRLEGAGSGPAVYRPREPDRFPQPEPFRQSLARAARLSEGGGGSGGAGSEARAAEAPGSAAAAPGATDEPTSARGGAPPRTAGDASGDDARLLPVRRVTGGEVEGPDGAPRAPVVLSLDARRHEAFRGRSLTVSGRARDASGHGVPGLRVEVWLEGREAVLLGVTVTREHGHFAASFGLPPTLPVGDYTLVVETPGDPEHGPARAP